MNNATDTPSNEATVPNRLGITLFGGSPAVRQVSAQVLVNAAELRGEDPDPWVVAVAEGRITT